MVFPVVMILSTKKRRHHNSCNIITGDYTLVRRLLWSNVKYIGESACQDNNKTMEGFTHGNIWLHAPLKKYLWISKLLIAKLPMSVKCMSNMCSCCMSPNTLLHIPLFSMKRRSTGCFHLPGVVLPSNVLEVIHSNVVSVLTVNFDWMCRRKPFVLFFLIQLHNNA